MPQVQPWLQMIVVRLNSPHGVEARCNRHLGLLSTASVCSTPRKNLQEGGLILLVTDGLNETLTPDGELFGMDRVLDIVGKHRHESAERIITAVFAASREFAAGVLQYDDVTIVILKVLSDRYDNLLLRN